MLITSCLDASLISLFRYEDIILGPRTIPNPTNPQQGKKEISMKAVFKVDLKANVVKLEENGKILDIGTELIYAVRSS